MTQTLRPALVSLLLLLALTGCSSWSSKDKDRFDPVDLEELKPAMGVHTQWKKSLRKITSGERLKLTPAISGGILFTADAEGRVEAHDAGSGKTVWKAELELPLSGGPGVGDGLVLVGSSEGDLVALEERSGVERWRQRLSSEVMSVPTADRGIAVAFTLDGRVHGLSAIDGRRLWTHDRPTPALTLYGSSSPVAYEGRVICGFANGKLAALNLVTGDQLWETTITLPSGRTDLERMVDINGDPVVRDGVIFAGTYQGELAALSLDSGSVFWRKQLSSHQQPSVNWRNVFVVDSDDQVWAINPRSGAAVWKNGSFKNRMLSPPAALGDYVLVGDLEGYVHWISQEDGAVLARTRVGSDPITLQPMVSGDTAYVLGSDGDLYALTPVPPEPKE